MINHGAARTSFGLLWGLLPVVDFSHDSWGYSRKQDYFFLFFFFLPCFRPSLNPSSRSKLFMRWLWINWMTSCYFAWIKRGNKQPLNNFNLVEIWCYVSSGRPLFGLYSLAVSVEGRLLVSLPPPFLMFIFLRSGLFFFFFLRDISLGMYAAPLLRCALEAAPRGRSEQFVLKKKKKKKEWVNSQITGIQRRAHLEVLTHAETGEYVVDMCACTQLCTSPMKSFLNIYNSPFKYKELNSDIEYFNRNGGLCGITQLNLEWTSFFFGLHIMEMEMCLMANKLQEMKWNWMNKNCNNFLKMYPSLPKTFHWDFLSLKCIYCCNFWGSCFRMPVSSQF